MIPSTDHLGQEFPSFSAMAAHWGHPRARVLRRLQRGRTLEEALTTPEGRRPVRSSIPRWVELKSLAEAMGDTEEGLTSKLKDLGVKIR